MDSRVSDDLYSPGGSISDEDLEKRKDRAVEVFGFGGGNDKKRKIFDDDSRADSNERESDLNDKSWRKDSGADDDKSLVSSSLDQSAGLIQLQPYDFDNIPPYSCVYCGIHDTRCVVQCKICNKWFCNGKGHP